MLGLIPRSKNKQLQRRQQAEQPLARLRNDFESLIDRMLNSWSDSGNVDQGFDLGLPEVEDRDNEIVVRAEAPGFEPDEIDVQLEGPYLTIRAETKSSTEAGNGASAEQSYRSLEEVVVLPDHIRADAIEAKYRNGILEIHVPKSEDAQPKRIAVQS